MAEDKNPETAVSHPLVPAVADAHQLPGLQEHLTQLSQLRENWNSHGAKPIDPSVLEHVKTFLEEVIDADVPFSQIVPRVDGTVQLEWHTKNKDLEIYLDAPGEGTFLYEDLGKSIEQEGDIRANLAELKEILHALAE